MNDVPENLNVSQATEKQGLATLRLEGLHLSDEERRMTQAYFARKMDYKSFLKKAADHARSKR